MNSLLVIIIVIIILLSIYLYLRHKQYNSIFESFDNTQSALSTYFQNTVDSDLNVGNNSFNKTSLDPMDIVKDIVKTWDGIWENKSLNMYAQFIQNNDKLIISFSNEAFIPAAPSTNGCTNNSFIGICQLNNDRNIFNLISVKCSTYTNTGLNMNPYQLSGYITGNIITLYSVGIAMNITLNRVKSFDYVNMSYLYNKIYSPNVNQNIMLADSEIVYEESLCENNTEPCMDKSNGLATTTYNNIPINACGKRTSATDNTCAPTSCVFYTPNNSTPQGLKTCNPPPKKIYDYMNFIPTSLKTNYTGNNLDICDYLQYFGQDKCNSCIICYVSNIGNVQTLNYQFFGSKPSESALTTQYDMMNQILNNKILSNFRNIINTGSNSPDINKAISFTNCIENIKVPSDTQKQQQNCITTCQQYVKSYVPSVSNNSLVPSVWEINFSTSRNTLNSCSFSLSTSKNYNTSVKHAEFNSDGSANLSLFGGGSKQDLVLENVNIIKVKSDNSSVIITANIKTNDRLYLLPSTDNNGFSNNSNVVQLSKSPQSNGKWLIIGFTLNNLNNLVSQINNIY